MDDETSRTVTSALRWAADALTQGGIRDPRLSAEILLCHALEMKRVELALNPDEVVTPQQFAAYRDMVLARASFRPLPYITGVQEFMGLKFKVNDRVLVPRPETEVLVEAVLERINRAEGSGFRVGNPPFTLSPQPSALVIADLGTGSGAIALSLAHFLPNAKVYATDVSAEALEVARENAAALGVANRVTFAQGDVCAPLRALNLQGQVDVITANLPYVPRGVIERLQPEVSRYEPRVALDGGEDGMDLIRRLAAEVGDFLRPGGFVASEMGIHQSETVGAIFRAAPSCGRLEIVKDYGGIERVAIAWA